jgi:hypothetical protein
MAGRVSDDIVCLGGVVQLGGCCGQKQVTTGDLQRGDGRLVAVQA